MADFIKNEYFGIFKMVSVSVPMLETGEDYLSLLTLRNWSSSGGKTHRSVGTSLETLSLTLVPTKPPAIYQLWLGFSYPGLVHMEISALVSCGSLYSPVFPILGGSCLPCDLIFLMTLRLDLSVCFAFY